VRRRTALAEGLDVKYEGLKLEVGDDAFVAGHAGVAFVEAFYHFGGRIENGFAEVRFIGDDGSVVGELDFVAGEAFPCRAHFSEGGAVSAVAGGAAHEFGKAFPFFDRDRCGVGSRRGSSRGEVDFNFSKILVLGNEGLEIARGEVGVVLKSLAGL